MESNTTNHKTHITSKVQCVLVTLIVKQTELVPNCHETQINIIQTCHRLFVWYLPNYGIKRIATLLLLPVSGATTVHRPGEKLKNHTNSRQRQKKSKKNKNVKSKSTTKKHKRRIPRTMQQSKLGFCFSNRKVEKTVEPRYLDKGKVLCQFSGEFLDSGYGDCGGVVEVVDSQYVVTGEKKLEDGVATNVSGTTGNQNHWHNESFWQERKKRKNTRE